MSTATSSQASIPAATPASVVAVRTPTASYDVVVGQGLLDSVGERLAALGLGGQAFVVSDSHVAPLYAEHVIASLEADGYDTHGFTFPAGEASKNLATLGEALDAMARAGLTRDDFALCLGGGVTGDLGGLAAALYMRGIACVQAPTSLLAMVDSSVGGKTAVDLAAGKNLAGAFWQPRAVIADVAALRSLSPALFLDSVGEVIKHAVLASPALFEELSRHPLTEGMTDEGCEGLDLDRVQAVVARNVAIKRDVVEADEREAGLRQTLNLGHTVGHAIEACANLALGHGTSVALGLCVEVRGAAALGLTPPAVARAVQDLVGAYGLPIECPYDVDELMAFMMSDKKRHANSVNLVVVRAIGDVAVRPMGIERLRELVGAGLRPL